MIFINLSSLNFLLSLLHTANLSLISLLQPRSSLQDTTHLMPVFSTCPKGRGPSISTALEKEMHFLLFLVFIVKWIEQQHKYLKGSFRPWTTCEPSVTEVMKPGGYPVAPASATTWTGEQQPPPPQDFLQHQPGNFEYRKSHFVFLAFEGSEPVQSFQTQLLTSLSSCWHLKS